MGDLMRVHKKSSCQKGKEHQIIWYSLGIDEVQQELTAGT